mmetsp:Transcript_33285/g.55007  ORF Transcript_33285/g.55007 Transcript_33285/m.55007 type:complete len:232 (-) Transcript_33285:231-926(-)|eukprot:CAMPEP_0119320978 /NCGR_PEP_ID=MMETSP1333-20130426/54051_1 /TAXON_ID=418940 /ORGANISM="Scyphosphaera apsteinii, Strain RCC1455" /LENGTH=231 /DNA_ID=CAMNT_0007327825 /DNA_START=69 /DNA_END=764 /DNA_ORIENTATION=+
MQGIELLKALTVRSWGVLGVQLTTQFEQVPHAPEPDASTVFVDPAGLPFIEHNCPDAAGAASRAVYNHVGISSFPEAVRTGITAATHAKFFSYGGGTEGVEAAGASTQAYQVIHVVGPDLRDPEYDSVEKASASLSEAYTNVLREFCKAKAADAKLTHLRLLPISGGIFAGAFAEELPTLTMGAIAAAYMAQPAEGREMLDSSTVELCIFMENEFESYVAAHLAVQQCEAA